MTDDQQGVPLSDDGTDDDSLTAFADHGEGDNSQVQHKRGTPGEDPEAADQPDPGDADEVDE